jgi:hypothetical protein
LILSHWMSLIMDRNPRNIVKRNHPNQQNANQRKLLKNANVNNIPFYRNKTYHNTVIG